MDHCCASAFAISHLEDSRAVLGLAADARGAQHLTGMEMTTYAKYRILLFSLELTDGKFLRVDNLEDGCSAIEAKAVFDEMRRTADVVDVGEGAGHRLSLVQEIDSFECRGIPRECRGIPL